MNRRDDADGQGIAGRSPADIPGRRPRSQPCFWPNLTRRAREPDDFWDGPSTGDHINARQPPRLMLMPD